MLDDKTLDFIKSKCAEVISLPNPSHRITIVLLLDGKDSGTVDIPTRFIQDCRWGIFGRALQILEENAKLAGPIDGKVIGFRLEPTPFRYEYSMDNIIKPNEQLPVNSLTGKDVTDFGKEVGRDSLKQAVVWTIASYAGKGFKALIKNIVGNAK